MAGKRLYTCNYSYFDIIDTEDKAYWLGFIYADGIMQNDIRKRILKTQISYQERKTVRIDLQIGDKHHLEKFMASVEGTYPVNEYRNGQFFCARVVIEDRHFYDSLYELGTVPNKSLVLMPPELPEQFILPFIRGYFDGDGCLSKHTTRYGTDEYEFSITGTKEVLEWIVSYLPVNKEVKMKQRHPENDTNNWTIKFCGNTQSYKTMNLLYENALIYLDRKYETYLNLAEHFSRLQEKSCRVRVGEPVNAGCEEKSLLTEEAAVVCIATDGNTVPSP